MFVLHGQFIYFVFLGIFSPVCFELSVPVQVITRKDSSPKSTIMSRAGM